MKKIYALLAALSFSFALFADDVNTDVVFVYADGTAVPDGTVITVNTAEEYDFATEGSDNDFYLTSGLYVRNDAGQVKQLKIEYTISEITGGYHQICYPGSCTTKDAVGSFAMPSDAGNPSPIKADVVADLEAEWFTASEGDCTVTYTLHIYQYNSGSYDDEGYGASVTVKYIYDPAHVTSVSSDEQVVKTTYYDLTGRRVSKPACGIYIVSKELLNGQVIANKVYIK